MKQRNFAVLCLFFIFLTAVFSGCSQKSDHSSQQTDPMTDVQTRVTAGSAETTTQPAESTAVSAETTALTAENTAASAETTAPTETSVLSASEDTASSEEPTEDWMLAFTVIGEVSGSNWDTDFEMVEEPVGTWTTVEAHDLYANANFLIRQGKAWGLYFGDNEGNVNPYPTDRWNYAVEVSGTYFIQLVFNASDKTGMIYLIPAEDSPEVPTEPSEPFSLEGTWHSVRRVGETLEEEYLVFLPDGTGYSGSAVYDNIHYRPFPDAVLDEGGWYLQPMGYPFEYFTYSLQDGILSVTITGSDFESYDNPISQTYAFEQVAADCIRLDTSYGTYIRGDSQSLKDLCEALNVDYSVS